MQQAKPPVCEYCKRRKQKCDLSLQGCTTCLNAGLECTFLDPIREQVLPRVYVDRLQQKHAALQLRIQHLRAVLDERTKKHETKEEKDVPASRYLGISSGMIFARVVMESAKHLGIFTPDQAVIEKEQEEKKDHEVLMAALLPPPSPTTISREAAEELFKVYIQTSSQYRILPQETYYMHLDRFCSTEGDPQDLFTIQIVAAIATLYVSRNSRNSSAISLAERYYSLALAHLPTLISSRSISALRAVLLVLQFSFINPQQSIVWHLLGFSLRLCVSLGLHSESNFDSSETTTSTIMDHYRDLFWCAYSMDRAVGNTLGRPTALQDKDISVRLPPTINFVTHGYQIRKLQSEVADVLYQCSLPFSSSFIPDMESRIDAWMTSAPDEHSDWLLHSYHNLTIFLHRPSMANPRPSSTDLYKCFTSASAVIGLYARMHSKSDIDCTWMAVHWLFLASITHLYCVWMSETIRESADWAKLNQDIQSTIMILSAMTERWHWAKGCLRLYMDLANGTLRKFVKAIYVPVDDDVVVVKDPEEIPYGLYHHRTQEDDLYLDRIMQFDPMGTTSMMDMDGLDF